MDGLKVGEAAARTEWSPRMLRYLERLGLVVPSRTRHGLPALRAARAEPAPLAPRAALPVRPRDLRPRLRGAAQARARAAQGRRRLARRRRRPRVGRVGTAKARTATDRRIAKGNDGSNEALRREGPRPRRRGQAADRVGRPADAGARRDPRPVREGAAARRLPHRRLPARHDGDGEPDADAEGGRRRRGVVRVEPALDAGRRRVGARRGVRHLASSRSRARTTTPTTRTSRPPSITSRT